LLRDIPTPIHALQMLRPGQKSPLPPWVRHCLQDRIISLLQVMHTAICTKVKPSYKNYHIDIYFKTKTVLTHAAKCLTQCHIFPNIQFSQT